MASRPRAARSRDTAPPATDSPTRISAVLMVVTESKAALPGETRLATDPVAAVPANRAIPAQPAQPEFQPVRIHKILDHAERAAITQPPLSDLGPAHDIGLFPAFIDMLVDEQHPPLPGQQTPQRLPELFEPAHRHMREPRREEDHIEPGIRVPREHVGNLKADICRPHAVTSERHRLGRRINSRHRVSPPRQGLRPQASPARDLQHASGRPHLRDQPRDTRASRSNVAVGRHVVLAHPATVVINLISKNLVGHPNIVTQRCDRRVGRSAGDRSTEPAPRPATTDAADSAKRPAFTYGPWLEY